MSNLDVTPLVVEGRQLIEAYGGGGFRVAGRVHRGSVIVLPESTLAWGVADAVAITVDSLAPAVSADPPAEVVLIGCGSRFVPPVREIRASLREIGVALEWMDTGAACRTFNVLLAEERRIAAALIAVD
jgi:uncharacterized protein